MKVLRVFFLLLMVCLVTGNTTLSAQTPHCNSSAASISKMWNAYQGKIPQDYRQHLQKADKAIQKFNQLIGGVLTVGPRSMKVSTKGAMRGTVIGGTNRMFITPPAFHKSVKITLRKLGGNARTGVTICVKDKNGSTSRIATYHFPRGRYTMNKEFILNNVEGKVISVNIRNYAAKLAGWKFQYDIKADGLSSNVNTGTTSGSVTLHEHDGYKGKSVKLKIGRYNHPGFFNQVGNDGASSVKLDNGLKITLYEHSNFRGKSVVIIGNTSSLRRKNFNDAASSAIVSKR